MTIIDTGFSEKAAERRARDEERAAVVSYLRSRAEMWVGAEDDGLTPLGGVSALLRGIALEVEEGKHA